MLASLAQPLENYQLRSTPMAMPANPTKKASVHVSISPLNHDSADKLDFPQPVPKAANRQGLRCPQQTCHQEQGH